VLDELEKTAWRGGAPRGGRLWHAATARASRREDGDDHGSWAWIRRRQRSYNGCEGGEQDPGLGIFFKSIFQVNNHTKDLNFCIRPTDINDILFFYHLNYIECDYQY
jgi:hypothetical protein